MEKSDSHCGWPQRVINLWDIKIKIKKNFWDTALIVQNECFRITVTTTIDSDDLISTIKGKISKVDFRHSSMNDKIYLQ